MSLPHDSSHTHVTGESQFVDDRTRLANEVHVGVVYSPHARAEVLSLDPGPALKEKGVLGVWTAADIVNNHWGTIFQDQPLIADREVFYAGEVIAVVAAESKEQLARGVKAVKVAYKLLPPILSIDEARKAQSFIGSRRKIERGEVEKNLAAPAHKLEGKVVIHGQDHFYLENQSAIAYPKEDGQIEVHSSAQHPTEVQHVVSHALGLASKDVVCVVTRMGGAFGGKESQAAPIAAYAALVAKKLNRPARLVLSKDDDMVMTGKRNPFETFFKVGFDSNGVIQAIDIELYSDGGAYADLSTAIMERAMLHCDNAYYLPHVRIQGQVCKTHVHPHTAFRGFGGPKGVATIERILEEIAHYLKRDALEVRKANCYSEGRDTTHYGQVVENNVLPRLFSQLEKNSAYSERRRDIETHNRKVLLGESKGSLRGLSMTAVKFGISFTTRFLNQGNALVVVHRDGTLQISTGATEMGQGVNARVAQLVCEELGLPRHRVRMMPTSTEKNANTSPTAASSGTDINGSAAVLATRKIKARLSEFATKLFQVPPEKWASKTAGLGTEPEITISKNLYDEDMPNDGADWKTGKQTFLDVEFEDGMVFLRSDPKRKIAFSDLVLEAYLNRISLSDYAHYRIPNLSFNKLTGEGQAFLYFTQGVCAAEVGVDLATGELKVARVDLLMDLGRPINEALDMGQVMGGFIQGMGWVTTENLFYSDKGLLLSHSPSTYKIPNVQDTPRIFNVKLLSNDENRVNLRGTKAVGEPPLLLGLSVWTAIQNALTYLPDYRKAFPAISIPATNEIILRAALPSFFSRWDGR